MVSERLSLITDSIRGILKMAVSHIWRERPSIAYSTRLLAILKYAYCELISSLFIVFSIPRKFSPNMSANQLYQVKSFDS